MSNQPWLTDLIQDKLLPILAQLVDCEADIQKAQQLNHWLRLRWVERGFKLTQQQCPLMEQTRAAINKSLGETHFSLRYIDFTPVESALIHDTTHQKEAALSSTHNQSSNTYTEHTQKNPKKHSTHFSLWSEDRHDLLSILHQFPGRNQRDRLSAWIAWSKSQLLDKANS